jgi:hypothetical protein
MSIGVIINYKSMFLSIFQLLNQELLGFDTLSSLESNENSIIFSFSVLLRLKSPPYIFLVEGELFH